MHLLLGQLVYTSFAKRGFKTLTSEMVSIDIEQAFMQRVAEYWDSYNPPTADYRAVYLYQLSPEQTLFGWLYHDGADDMGRSDVPLFVCYYLSEPLFDFQLANIFTCLEKGPVGLIDRHNRSAYLETKVIPNLWSYQPARQGIAIPLAVRQHSYFALRQGELLNVFVPVYEQETVIDLNGQTYEQQLATLSIYTHYVIDGLNPDYTDLDDENATTERTARQAQQSYIQKNKYTQALARINQPSDTSSNTRNLLVKQKTRQPIKTKFNQQKVVNDTADNYTFTSKKSANNIYGSNVSPLAKKRANYDCVLAYQKTQLLLKIGIGASVLALAFGVYGLWQVNVSNSSYRNSISRGSGTVKYNKLADVPNVPQGQFSYGGSTSEALLRSQTITQAINQVLPQYKSVYTDPPTDKHRSGIDIAMLLAQQLSFAPSRPIKESEFQQAQIGITLTQIPIAIDGIAFYVNPLVSILGLSSNQIRDIFTGRITNKQIGSSELPITPFTRNPQ